MDNLGDLVGMALEEENVAEACSALEQLLDEAFGESIPPGTSDGMISAARRAQDCIDVHYFEDISLTSVAEMLGVDRAYLSRAFKQATGCNIMLAIAKKRIAKAEECIMRGDLSLTDIADLVGYGDYAYFNRVFRKVSGMSPSEYKASLHGGSS
jgi:YesN/AraC family two-component response regulator